MTTRAEILALWFDLAFCREWWRPLDIAQVHWPAICFLIDPKQLD
jgi:hypothetical protein